MAWPDQVEMMVKFGHAHIKAVMDQIENKNNCVITGLKLGYRNGYLRHAVVFIRIILMVPSKLHGKTFRQLIVADAEAMYALEQAVIAAKPSSKSSSEIHDASLDTFRQRLADIGRITYIGMFEGDRLVGFGGSVKSSEVDDLVAYDTVSLHPLSKGFRYAALPVCANGCPTAMNAWLRVHPEYQCKGIGPALVEERLKAVLGLRQDGQNVPYDYPEPAGLVVTNVSTTNRDSITAQFRSSITTPLIFSAGYDVDTEGHPGNLYIAHLNPKMIAYSDLPVLRIMSEDRAFESGFDEFADYLDTGHVGYKMNEYQGFVVLSHRPDNILGHIPIEALRAKNG